MTELKDMRVEFADSDETQSRECDINLLLECIGVNAAFVSDESCLSDFCDLGEIESDMLAIIRKKIGSFDCPADLYLWQLVDTISRQIPDWREKCQ